MTCAIPWGAIVLTSELIARTTGEATTATAAQRLIRSGQRMRELLDKLLVYNRAQMGLGFEIQKEDVDLVTACREEIELLRASTPEARIQFHSPESVRGQFDAVSIRQALANLVVNAHKYGQRGGEIRVVLRNDDGGVALDVTNEGDPIAPETLELMFEPLRRGGVSSGDLEQASLGLGLFIVSQIAQAHQGTIRAESSGGQDDLSAAPAARLMRAT
ncbi:sensor histidine kinase [Agrilutibacter solisilvae]|uniref:HAMP domain-containing histidine kinase n=1 Tax=Agrilutibacter solisilvae TaxID=2763317 RepID=A0A974Y006_9GAMM|nr:HAMP domain-containing sensor histidine kinase [Lysobacter solisilvae]QSX78063.1 HAMP domain-containing histidine kinase [Lysobacter solisilvae]